MADAPPDPKPILQVGGSKEQSHQATCAAIRNASHRNPHRACRRIQSPAKRCADEDHLRADSGTKIGSRPAGAPNGATLRFSATEDRREVPTGPRPRTTSVTNAEISHSRKRDKGHRSSPNLGGGPDLTRSLALSSCGGPQAAETGNGPRLSAFRPPDRWFGALFWEWPSSFEGPPPRSFFPASPVTAVCQASGFRCRSVGNNLIAITTIKHHETEPPLGGGRNRNPKIGYKNEPLD